MNSHNKILFSFLFLVIFLPPLMAIADEMPTQCIISHDIGKVGDISCNKNQTINLGDKDSICCLINTLYNVRDWLFTILLTVAAIFIIIAGYNFVTAGGDPTKITAARNFVLYALIGVLVAIASTGMIELVKKIVGYQ
jgi:hypothetical protein